MKNTILLFGGPSSERLVSVASAQNIAPHIDATLWFWSKEGPIYVIGRDELLAHKRPFEDELKLSQAPSWPNLATALDDPETSTEKPTFFLGLHGTMGEDGVIQAELEKRGYHFTGSGSAASRTAFDKVKTKEVAVSKSIRVARSIQSHSSDPKKFSDDIGEALRSFESIVIKPTLSGSSDGLTFLSSGDQIEVALQKLLNRDPEPYLIEERILGREITVGVTETIEGLVALPASEVIIKKDSSFDYAGKYLGKGSTEVTPADISEKQMIEAQNIAKTIHEALGCRGYSRTDLILDEKGYVFLEINTLPGLSKASFIPQQLAAQGIQLDNFIQDQLAVARSK